MSERVLSSEIDRLWQTTTLNALSAFVSIPNQSPLFDPNWSRNRHLARAAELITSWAENLCISGMKIEFMEIDGRTPFIMLDVPSNDGSDDGPVVFYGHYDKQPPGEGWSSGLSPHQPVIRNDRLFGRGAADDGWAPFSVLTAIQAMESIGLAHPRCVLLVDGSEESQSIDLDTYLAAISPRLGSPRLVVALDSICGDYERLWATSSIRASVVATLTVRVLEHGVHSGIASGVAPSSFRIARRLLDRIEDPDTGRLRLDSVPISIPETHRNEASIVTSIVGDYATVDIPHSPELSLVSQSPEERLLAQTWGAAMEVTGQSGISLLSEASNILRPFTTLKLALRLPPTSDPDAVAAELSTLLMHDPPHNARVELSVLGTGSGWVMPPRSAKLEATLENASRQWFGNRPATIGVGGGIPFLNRIERSFPDAELLVLGVLGPGSNPHGPDESLHLPMARAMTGCLATILTSYAID